MQKKKTDQESRHSQSKPRHTAEQAGYRSADGTTTFNAPAERTIALTLGSGGQVDAFHMECASFHRCFSSIRNRTGGSRHVSVAQFTSCRQPHASKHPG